MRRQSTIQDGLFIGRQISTRETAPGAGKESISVTLRLYRALRQCLLIDRKMVENFGSRAIRKIRGISIRRRRAGEHGLLVRCEVAVEETSASTSSECRAVAAGTHRTLDNSPLVIGDTDA